MIRDTPCLANKVHSSSARDSGNTLRQKVFTGGRLSVVGANSPAGLASRPVRIVLADEVDRFPISAASEGDPLALASKRQATFWNQKNVARLDANDQRYKHDLAGVAGVRSCAAISCRAAPAASSRC